jgi:hypothetical protein
MEMCLLVIAVGDTKLSKQQSKIQELVSYLLGHPSESPGNDDLEKMAHGMMRRKRKKAKRVKTCLPVDAGKCGFFFTLSVRAAYPPAGMDKSEKANRPAASGEVG